MEVERRIFKDVSPHITCMSLRTEFESVVAYHLMIDLNFDDLRFFLSHDPKKLTVVNHKNFTILVNNAKR